jgi:metallo-beta-lactamase family protein
VLEDAAHIQEEDVAAKRRRHEREGRTGPHPLVPLFTREDVDATMELVDTADYVKPVRLADGLEVRFHDAGHILGSAMVEIGVRENGEASGIVFSGDLGEWGAPLVEDPAIIPQADHVVMESTYGDRDHEVGEGIEDHLARIVGETVARGGDLIIPTFAIDRAQDLLYFFSRLVADARIPPVGVYLDSPMAIDVTAVYRQYAYLLDGRTRALFKEGRHPFQFRGLHLVRNPQESARLQATRGPKVVLAGSGMCTGGRIKHHLRQGIGRRESTVLFTGFQAEDTLGRQILDGASEVRIHGEWVRVRARVERLFGLSAHSGRSGLMRWLGHYRRPPKRLFLTHGEAAAAESLAGHVRERLGWEVAVPVYREIVDLS